MDSSQLSPIVDLIAQNGSYGLVAILGWAFWHLSRRKDAELKELYNRMMELSENQTAAIIKVESALVALKDAIQVMRKELLSGRQEVTTISKRPERRLDVKL